MSIEAEMQGKGLLTIEQISEELNGRKISSSVLVEEDLRRIHDVNPQMKLFITITADKARGSAKQTDARVATSKRLGRLDGIPVAIKDNFFIRGVRCTAGSKILSDFIPDYSAPTVERLEEAGAAIVGTTNLHEFASGVTSVNPYYGAARNPWNTERITGGSSGGSAAAVAAGLAFAALGTDTSGSVRIPASLCGVVGLKPTFGLVSTRGTIPLSTSLDHVGVLTRNCLDAALLLDLLAGFDERDPASVRTPRKYNYFQESISARDKGHKIGVPRNYFLDGLDQDVSNAFEKVVIELGSLGFELDDIEIPDINRSAGIWAPIRFSEATAYHQSWLESRPSDYSEDVRRKLERGKEFSAIEYISAKRQASEFRSASITTFGQFDAIITPTTPVPAPKIGETNVPLGTSQTDIYTALVRQTLPFNVSGLPAVSVPMGLSRDGLPLGLQIVGKPFDEGTILGIGSAYEQKFRKTGLAPLVSS